MSKLFDAERLALETLADGDRHLVDPPATPSQLMWLACAGLADVILYGDRPMFQITADGREALKSGVYYADLRDCLRKADDFLDQGFDPAWLVGCLVQICLWQDEQIESLRESSRVDPD